MSIESAIQDLNTIIAELDLLSPHFDSKDTRATWLRIERAKEELGYAVDYIMDGRGERDCEG